MKETLSRWDIDLLIWINSLGSESTDTFWLYVTSVWTWFPLFILIVILFFIHLTREKAVLATLFFGGTGMLALFIKELTKRGFERLRPCNVEELAASLRVLTCKDSFSFFSGHASFSFALITFTVLVLRRRVKWIQLTFIWPILFAVSRMISGVHYPSDIIVGAGVGILVGIFTNALYQKDLIKLPRFIQEKLRF